MKLLYGCWLPHKLACHEVKNKLIERIPKITEHERTALQKEWYSSNTQHRREYYSSYGIGTSQPPLQLFHLPQQCITLKTRRFPCFYSLFLFLLLPAFWIQTSTPLKKATWNTYSALQTESYCGTTIPPLRNAIFLLENKTKIKEFELQKQNSTLQFTHLMKVFEYTEDPKPELINFFAVP